MMTEEDERMVLDTIKEKWSVRFTMPDGTISGGFCNSLTALPIMIQKIRRDGGQNIVITDETVFYVDAKED